MNNLIKESNSNGIWQKTWFRILISLLGGSFLSEMILINTSEPNRTRTFFDFLIMIVCIAIFYFLLTKILIVMGKIK